MIRRGAEHYLIDDGAVWVPAAVADILIRRAGLGDYRRRSRGEDADVDAVLIALTLAALKHRGEATEPGRTSAPTSDSAPPSRHWITTSQAATRLRISERTVRRSIAAGRIDAVRVGWAWLVDPAQLTRRDAA